MLALHFKYEDMYMFGERSGKLLLECGIGSVEEDYYLCVYFFTTNYFVFVAFSFLLSCFLLAFYFSFFFSPGLEIEF